ncbi:DsrE family protein [Alphaproteobacteria bacterium]|nr:DsrE family protein [Alphaproteobacteria bacterium]MDC1023310.1 DsrE family protein [Alphaproteobacteria bacterium]
MSKILIHIHSGPDLKNKATLGMLVAITAFKEGYEVNIFLAADGTHLLNIKTEGEVVGQGTGDLKNHLDELKQNGVKLYVSGMSAKARGYDESLLDGFNAEFAMPDKLLVLSTKSDTVLCY